MANILIIPSGGNVYFNTGSAGSSEVANLSGSGVALNYDGAAGLNIVSYNTNDLERFTVDGSNGRLFNVSDEVTGDIFSVNDAAGLPIINVYSDTGVDVVTIGTYGIEPLTVSGSGISITGYMTLNNEPTLDKHAATKKYVDDHAVVAATTTTTGHVELATDAEAHAATDTTRAVTPSNLLIKKDGTAIVAGDLTGNSRGAGALDVQAGRNSSTQVASGASSSAVGYDNRASGTSSSAFGYYNNASVSRSSAFGYSNETLGDNSSAFGYQNAASGGNSSAFGYSNTASVDFSNAFGYVNTASGSFSSAFGKSNTASGGSSSAIGSGNTASAYNTSAFGYANTASGGYSAAFGKNNTASGGSSTAFGYLNTASGGFGSSAFGFQNTASAYQSSAFGFQNTASTINSAAFGRSNFVSTGDASVAIGILNNQTGGTINVTTGVISGIPAAAACGDLSTAVGISNKASGGRSSAVGYNNTASGERSSAFGYKNTASGYKSSVFGYNNNVSANDGSAFGKSNTISGNYGSSAFGYYNTSSGFNGMTVGSYNTASGFSRASAFGYNNTASGDLSSTFGYNNTASGNYSIAVGYQSASSGNNSIAVGYQNTSSGDKSSAFGYVNTASGERSSAFGHYAQTTVNNTFEAGYWSDTTTRGGAIRMHPNGQVAMTVEDSSSAPTDGGATAGSEADGTLPRGMVAFRKNGADLYVDSNTSGTVSTLGLGILQSARVYSPRFIQSYVTGSGAARLSGQASSHTCQLQTGATTGSTAGATIGGNVALINGAALDGDNPNVINFSRKQSCLFKFATNASASCTGWIFWGGPFNSVWTGGPTGKSIGLKLDGNALKLVAHDGSSATTGSSILTMTANITYEILIVADGSGNLEAFRNGTSLGTITGAPTGSTAAPVYPSAQAVIENNATTTNANLQVLGIDIVAGELQ